MNLYNLCDVVEPQYFNAMLIGLFRSTIGMKVKWTLIIALVAILFFINSECSGKRQRQKRSDAHKGTRPMNLDRKQSKLVDQKVTKASGSPKQKTQGNPLRHQRHHGQRPELTSREALSRRSIPQAATLAKRPLRQGLRQESTRKNGKGAKSKRAMAQGMQVSKHPRESPKRSLQKALKDEHLSRHSQSKTAKRPPVVPETNSSRKSIKDSAKKPLTRHPGRASR